jgi:hypothetical protein
MTSINKELQIWQKLFNHIKSALHKSAWDLIEKRPLHSQHKQVRGERIPLQIPRSWWFFPSRHNRQGRLGYTIHYLCNVSLVCRLGVKLLWRGLIMPSSKGRLILSAKTFVISLQVPLQRLIYRTELFNRIRRVHHRNQYR